MNEYSQTNAKAVPDHMEGVSLIRFQQNMEELRSFAFYNRSVIHEICHWHGRSKIDLKRLKDQDRREYYLSIQGCKRARGETGECATLSKTEGVYADMKNIAYKWPGELTQKIVARTAGKGPIK